MYFARYHFAGDPDELTTRYRTLLASRGGEYDLQVAVRRSDGIDVYDTCPSEGDFAWFSTSEQFRAALAAVGLPLPHAEGLGEIFELTSTQAVG